MLAYGGHGLGKW